VAAGGDNGEVRVRSRGVLVGVGGSGMCHMRLGPSASPAIPAGEADILIALEMSEALRALPMARRGAQAFINTYHRVPIAAGVAGLHYPTQAEIERALQEASVTGVFVPELLPASMTEANEDQQHDSRINIIMLGVFAGY